MGVSSVENEVWRGLSFWSSVALFAGLAVLVFKVAQLYIGFRKHCQAISRIPSPPKHWLMGHLLVFPGPNEEGLTYQRELASEYPKVSIGWLSSFLPLITIYHPDTMKKILQTSEPKGPMYNLVIEWLGEGLLVSKGAKWLRNRRLLTPAFHFDILKPYTNINNRCADVFMRKLNKFASQGDYFEVMQHVSMYTLDVILKCAFSYDTNCQSLGTQHPYVKAVNEMSLLATERFMKPWFHNDYLYLLTPSGWRFRKNCKFVHDVAQQVIAERRKTLDGGLEEEAKGKKCLDFLDILLRAKDENEAGLTDMEIRNEVDTFLFEGHDTTASGISWTLWSLSQHPEHQRRVQEEVDDILDDRESGDITWEDLHNMPHLTMCIKEGLRLHSSVPLLQRKLVNELVIEGVTLPVGTIVNISMYMLHHNNSVWENSLEYIPERFSPENAEKRDPFAFLPFSAGPRNCIGQNFAMNEMKVIIARILREFDLTPQPGHVPRKSQELVMRTENGIHIIPRLRNRKRK